MSIRGVSAPGAVPAPRQDDQAADSKRVPNNKGIDVGIVHTTGPVGDISADFDQFMAFLRGETPDRPAANGTEKLNQIVGDAGGSTQLQAIRYYNHAANQTIALERFSEQGVQPTDEQLAEAVKLLDEQSDWEILQTLSGAEAAGSLGKSESAAGVFYNGIDLKGIEFSKLAADAKVPLLPEDVASLTDAECTAAVDQLLGAEGGGPEMSKARNDLKGDPAALAQFDRGLLSTLGSTLIAAYNDPNYAKQLGLEFPTDDKTGTTDEGDGGDGAGAATEGGEIPEKYQGDLMMLLAYVFAKRDQEITKKVTKYASEFNSDNAKLSKAKKGDPALENSTSYKEMQLKTAMSQLEKNSAMGATLIDGYAASRKRLWG